MNKNIKIRAIYVGDVRFDKCPVFELNHETGYFEMLGDTDFKYEKEVVENDNDFIIFIVNGDNVVLANEN